jgi:hypothetical protein
MKVICCALLFLTAVAHGANIQRLARNTEGIIPSIVEEILKVELKSDLKKNSAVEVEVQEPIVKDEVVVEPAISRTVEEEKTVVEEKMPVVVETIVETVPSVRTIAEEEKMPEMVEKVEIVAIETVPEKVADNFRAEVEPSVEEPKVVEIIKETIVVEPVVPELRNAPVSEILIKEEEIIKPMVRNVVKEEIPQVEELRVVPEVDAVKETLPEPIAASNIVQPVVEVEPQVKTVTFDTIKEETPMKIEEIVVEQVKSVPEMIMMTKTEEMPEVKAVEMMMEKIMEPEIVKDEVKAVVVETEKMEDEMIMPGVKSIEDGRQNIIQQTVQSVQNAIQPAIQPVLNSLQNVPVVGQIVQRITPTTAEPVAPAAEEEVQSDSESPVVQAPTAPSPGPIQQLVQSVQSNVQQFFNPSANNAAGENQGDPPRPNIIQQIVSGTQEQFSNLVQNVQNAFRPNASDTPVKAEEKPDETPAETVAEEAKSVEPQPQPIVEPSEQVIVKKEDVPVEKVENTETQS